jgi:hypothetical protein
MLLISWWAGVVVSDSRCFRSDPIAAGLPRRFSDALRAYFASATNGKS